MEIEGMEIVRMELKYCETEDVYCPECAVEMSDLPEGRRRTKAAFAGERPSRHQEPVRRLVGDLR